MHLLDTILLGIAAALFCTTTLAQITGGPGVVVAVHENGTATVRIANQEQMVMLPNAKVGDKVVCNAINDKIKWECRLHKG